MSTLNRAVLSKLACMQAALDILVTNSNSAADYTAQLAQIISLLESLETDTTSIEQILTDISGDTSSIVLTLADVLNQVTAINENTDDVEQLLTDILGQLLAPGMNQVAFAPACANVNGVDGVEVQPVRNFDIKTGQPVGAPIYFNSLGVVIAGIVADSTNPDCDCAPCVDCDDVLMQACILFSGFDADRGLLQAGETTSFDIAVDGVSQAVIVHDYTTSDDGVNVSSYYTPVIAAINALPNWAIAVEEDVAVADQGKVVWQLEHTGNVAETLDITKTPNGDVLTFASDGAGNIVGASDDGNGNAFASDPFDHPDCVPGDGAPTPPPGINGFNVVTAEGQGTKIDLDNPAFDDRYTDIVGAWTAADLVAKLNADAALAPVPYDTTVWQLHPTFPTIIQVASGPVPTTVDFISLSISVPFTP